MTMSVQIQQLDAPPPLSGIVQTGVIAQPGGQVGATPLTARTSIVTNCVAGAGVVLQILPIPEQKVFNRCGTGQQLLVFPAPGTKIEGAALNVPVTVADSGVASFTYDGTQTWLVS